MGRAAIPWNSHDVRSICLPKEVVGERSDMTDYFGDVKDATRVLGSFVFIFPGSIVEFGLLQESGNMAA